MKLSFSILLISWIFFSETRPSGIFIVVDPAKKIPCTQKLKMLVGTKKICLSKMPIINTDEIEYVTEILYHPKLKLNYINIGLSSKSIKALNETNTFIPHAQFALVVENDVICIFTIEERFTDRYLRIGADLDRKNLTLVHNALKRFNKPK